MRELSPLLVTVSMLFCAWPAWVRAELRPEEIALVAARRSRESQALAEYYCRMRGVPEKNICLVDVPVGEELARDTWQWSVRPEIRKWLEEHDPQEKLRCLVTLWDVPLKIAPVPVDLRLQRYQGFLAAERNHRLTMLKRIARELERLAGGRVAIGEVELAPDDDLKSVQTALESALQAAQKAIGAKAEGPEREQASGRLQQLATAAGGAQVLLQGIDQQLTRLKDDAPRELRSQFDLLRGRTATLAEVKGLLDLRAPDEERDAMVLVAVEGATGLLGTVQWLDEQIAIAKKNETESSFDSELSLVMWPDDYQLLRWQPNYLRANYDNTQLRQFRRTLMVARIDGPTLEIAKRLIDDAIAVEKAGGLKGKVYLDARGLAKLDGPKASPGSYEDYDRSLLATAKGIEEQTDFEVVLNEQPELFQPGECPEAALYCGWYSLGKYVDAFEFVPGAVAYHLASVEARTIREEGAQNWVPRMLARGCAGVAGPVYSPGIIAFPRPDEFFAVLMRGDLTLVEAYYRTLPFNSWMMVLVGDPLYRPFVSSQQSVN